MFWHHESEEILKGASWLVLTILEGDMIELAINRSCEGVFGEKKNTFVLFESQITGHIESGSSVGSWCEMDFPTAPKWNVIRKVRGLETARQSLWPWTAPANDPELPGMLGGV